MIKRIWHGWTSAEKADEYETLVRNEVFVGIRARHIAGFRNIELLRRESDSEVEFVSIMTFDSLAAVRSFAGEDYERSFVPDKARALLSRFNDRSSHFEIRIPETGQSEPKI